MAEALSSEKLRLRMQAHLHSLSIQFSNDSVQMPTTFPPLYVRLSRGSRFVESARVSLEESPPASRIFTARWEGDVLPIVLGLSRDVETGTFASKDVKFLLKIYSESKSSHKTLANCTFDAVQLNLAALDFMPSSTERKLLELSVGKNATNAIKGVILEVTFQFEFLKEEGISSFASQSDATSPPPSLPSPVSSPLFEELPQAKSTPSLFIKETSTTTKESLPAETIQKSTTANSMHPPAEDERGLDDILPDKLVDRVTDPSPTHSPTTFKEAPPVTAAKPPKPPKSSKAKKLKEIFKIRGRKGKRESPKYEAPPSPAAFSYKQNVKAQAGRDVLQEEQHTFAEKSKLDDSATKQIPEKAELENEFRKVVVNPSLTKPNSNDKSDEVIAFSTEPKIESITESVHPPKRRVTDEEHKAETSREAEVSKKPTRRSGVSNMPYLESTPTTSRNDSGGGVTPQSEDRSQSTREVLQSKSYSMHLNAVEGIVGTTRIAPHDDGKGYYSPEPAITSSLIERGQLESERIRSLSAAPYPPSSGYTKSHRNAPHLSKVLSGSTPLLPGSNLPKGRRYVSTSDLLQNSGKKLSIGDLARPTRSSNLDLHKVGVGQDSLGVLKIRLSAVNIADNPQHSRRSLTDIVFNEESGKDLAELKQAPTDGIFCVFTINGSNCRAESSTQPIVPRRPVVWDKNENVLFYTTQSRQVFITCRRTKLSGSQARLPIVSGGCSPTVGKRKSQAQDEACIGAAVLPVISVKATTAAGFSSGDVLQVLSKQACVPRSLPLQPKGSVLLQTTFYALEPRFKVSCKGTITIQSVSGLDCNPDHDISCSIKIDSDFQDATSVLSVEESATEGWKEEPVEFNAYNSLDCDIQIWAYSSEETEYWCGGCAIPLALLLPDKHIPIHTTSPSTFVVSKPCEKVVTVPVEPKGSMTVSFLLYPSPRSRSQSVTSGEEETTSPRISPSPEPTAPNDVEVSLIPEGSKYGSLRRNLATTIRRAGGFSLRVRKTYSEEPFILQQENSDLKREIEFLRKELRQTKAKLAESEFFREKALLELRGIQEQFKEHRIKPSYRKHGSK